MAYKFQVGTQKFRFRCDSSEYSFQLCLPYRTAKPEAIGIRLYDDSSYGVWDYEANMFREIFHVRLIEED